MAKSKDVITQIKKATRRKFKTDGFGSTGGGMNIDLTLLK